MSDWPFRSNLLACRDRTAFGRLAHLGVAAGRSSSVRQVSWTEAGLRPVRPVIFLTRCRIAERLGLDAEVLTCKQPAPARLVLQRGRSTLRRVVVAALTAQPPRLLLPDIGRWPGLTRPF